MKKILALGISCLLFFTSCSTIPLKPLPLPSKQRLDYLKKSLASESFSNKLENESEKLAFSYLQGLREEKKGNKELACEMFAQLAKNKQFILQDSALVHSISVCDFSLRKLKKIWADTSVSHYLEETYLEISKKRAIELKERGFEAEFSAALIKYKSTQAEKIKLIQQAINLASGENNEILKNEFIKQRKEISPMYQDEINEKNIYLVAKDFESNRQFAKARELYLKIINSHQDLDEKIKAYNSYRISYKVERNLKVFLEKTYEMEKFLENEFHKDEENKKTREAWIESKITLARAIWTNHQSEEAQKILSDIIKKNLGNSNQLANTEYIIGSLLIENKKNKEALKHFENAHRFKITDTSLKENIEWSIVWNQYLLKKDKSVIQFASDFIKKSSNQLFANKLSFWTAKSMLRLGQNEQARVLFSDLIKNDSFGYYGILSALTTQYSLSTLSSSTEDFISSGDLTLDWLIAMDETILAQKYLKEIDAKAKSQNERELRMSLYYQTSWFQGGMRQLYNFKQKIRNSLTEKYNNVIFPTPYMKTIELYSQKYKVPKELIFAIIRQESVFVPFERSWADAFGLMQLIPEKASLLAKKFHVDYQNYNDLYTPETNLELGTALLSELMKKHKSKFAQTVASYNASDEAIATWERDRFNGDYLEFIEMIPYEETRNYIKLVFRNFIIYKRIMMKNNFVINQDFFANPF